jgi:hypothetical protein
MSIWSNGEKQKSDRELLTEIYKMCKSFEERLDDLEEALGGDANIKEKQSLKQDLDKRNDFLQNLCMKLVENQGATSVAAATKPSALELYNQRKIAETNNASVANNNKPTTNGPRLPG